MKVLFLFEHISTGGGPQYLFTCAQKLKNAGEEVSVAIWKDIAPAYDVQRKKLQALLDGKFYMLGNDKIKNLSDIVLTEQPDVIHMMEFPEIWAPAELIQLVYKPDRKWKVIETSHDSGFLPKDKRTRPDGFAFISKFHAQQYKDFGVPFEIVEYPIEKHDRLDRFRTLLKLGLDPEWLHVLNVGLFTPRKNQAEIFEIARKMKDYKILFHFVGNQAENFKSYWKPLMDDLPGNCRIWGERSDVDQFYGSMDAFYFASKGTDTDRETNPLVLKEALGWGMPVLMYNLPVYCRMYDGNPLVTYINDDVGNSCYKLLDVLEGRVPIDVWEDIDKYKDYVALHFRVPIDMNAFVSIHDMELGYQIYGNQMELKAGTEYFMFTQTCHYHVTGAVLRIDDGKGKLASRGFDYGNTFQNFIFNSKIQMSVPPRVSTWYTYYEVFMRGEYKDFPINRGDTVVDLGANIGFFTIYAVGEGAGRVFSVEPDKESIFCLSKTLEVNKEKLGLSKVHLVNAAMSDCQGEAEFSRFPTAPTMNVLSSIDLGYLKDKMDSAKVQTITFNSLIEGYCGYKIDHIHLLKVDIEGSEYAMFQAADKEYLSKHVDKIVMEAHTASRSTDVNERWGKLKDLVNLLVDCGFEVKIGEAHDGDVVKLAARKGVGK